MIRYEEIVARLNGAYELRLKSEFKSALELLGPILKLEAPPALAMALAPSNWLLMDPITGLN